jgi:alkylation response protein AidB-like acyl-CoA dehydrogenase
MADTTAAAAAADVRRAVDAALDLVADRADEIERERRIADDVVAALRASGMNRMAMPEALGGLESPVVEVVDLVERIAAVDASTAWCAVIGGGSNLFAGYIGEAAAREVFRDPDQGNATMFAPNGTVAGSRLTGRWPFASNVVHSAWIGLGAFVRPSDGGSPDPVPRVCFVPVSDLAIEDTWDAMGLRGTGSHHVRASDVPVDLARSCTFADRPWPEGTLWRVPIYCALLPTLAAVPLGIGRGALDEVARQTRTAARPAGARSATTRRPSPPWRRPTPGWRRHGQGSGRWWGRRTTWPPGARRSRANCRPARTCSACWRRTWGPT